MKQSIFWNAPWRLEEEKKYTKEHDLQLL
jgi:hypothetical protein